MPEYLTEKSLIDYIKQATPFELTTNKSLKPSNFRPDIYIKELNIIVEFDGYQHFTDSDVILQDMRKDIFYHQENIKCIRIPYFIQWCPYIENFIFNSTSTDTTSTYPHGFIDAKAKLPASFCYLGLGRFWWIVSQQHPRLAKNILDSLELHKKEKPQEYVCPDLGLLEITKHQFETIYIKKIYQKD